MPQRQTLITWQALNVYNAASPTGQTDYRTGLPFQTGGLSQGDYFDLTQTEALGLSALQVGRLYGGRYRMVQVDPNATAANIATGTLAAWAPGDKVEAAALLTAGTGQLPGVYQVAGVGGGGAGAVLQVIVGANGTVTIAPLVLNPGGNYTGVPTFTLAAGGTPATFAALMTARFNTVTSYDKAVGPSLVRGVFLNALTPGNYGFLQELGIATVLGAATAGSTNAGALLAASSTGLASSSAGTTSPNGATFGRAFDAPAASSLFRAILDLPTLEG